MTNISNLLLLTLISLFALSCAQVPSREIASVKSDSSKVGFRSISEIEDPSALDENIFFKDDQEE